MSEKNSSHGIICPFCDHLEKPSDQEAWSMYDENLSEWKCCDCGKEFQVTVHCSYSWSYEPDELHYYNEGAAAQKRGTYIDECPYPDGSREYGDWHDGYSDADIEEAGGVPV